MQAQFAFIESDMYFAGTPPAFAPPFNVFGCPQLASPCHVLWRYRPPRAPHIESDVYVTGASRPCPPYRAMYVLVPTHPSKPPSSTCFACTSQPPYGASTWHVLVPALVACVDPTLHPLAAERERERGLYYYQHGRDALRQACCRTTTSTRCSFSPSCTLSRPGVHTLTRCLAESSTLHHLPTTSHHLPALECTSAGLLINNDVYAMQLAPLFGDRLFQTVSDFLFRPRSACPHANLRE
ncbi:hypothetical protein T484DRAFT_2784773 [Baffinella frigidus]|nr:hypothetical protein T484DRAFT_2784773 [Cryptophyta sp. CCMP2293]